MRESTSISRVLAKRMRAVRVAFFLAGFLAGSPAGILAGILAGFLGLESRFANAATGSVMQLPASMAKAKSGLKLEIDARGVASNGYRPVRVELSTWPPVAATSDRQIRIELNTDNWGHGPRSPLVVQTVDLPQGKLRATAIVSVPQFTRWNNLRVETFEGGRKVDELSGWHNLNQNGSYYAWSESTPAMLFIDLDAPTRDQRDGLAAVYRRGGQTAYANQYRLPDFRGLALTIPSDHQDVVLNANEQPLHDQSLLRLLDELPKLDLLSAADLPTRWIDYSCFDLVVVSLSDLQRLAAERPAQFTALRQWVRMGATLVVYGVGEDFAQLSQLESLLEEPPLTVEGAGAPDGWTRPIPQTFGDQVLRSISTGSTRTMNNHRVVQHSATMTTDPQDRLLELSTRPPAKPPFVLRPLQFGAVVAFSANNPFPGSAQKWCWMLNTLGEERYKWHMRHGVSEHRSNLEFWDWLIPGVGQAPVVSFLVLITLFAVVIGPVNYYVLRRLRRRYLLLVTVPAGAFVVTFCLLGYALITDGLGTKLRIRGTTWLDQTSGEAVSWSRQTYYSSIAPSRGLEFPRNTVVLPIYGEPWDNWDNSGRTTQRLNWEERQRLDREYLQSRVTTQFVVGNAGPSDLELVVTAAAGGGPPSVENLLAARIDQLLLRDEQGDLFRTQDLKPGERTTLQPTTAMDIRQTLVAAYQANQPQTPGKLDSKSFGNAFIFSVFQSRGGPDVDTGEPDVSFRRSMLERSAKQYLEFPERLPRRHYVAVIRGGSPAPTGVRRARQVASFQVIIGRW